VTAELDEVELDEVELDEEDAGFVLVDETVESVDGVTREFEDVLGADVT